MLRPGAATVCPALVRCRSRHPGLYPQAIALEIEERAGPATLLERSASLVGGRRLAGAIDTAGRVLLRGVIRVRRAVVYEAVGIELVTLQAHVDDVFVGVFVRDRRTIATPLHGLPGD